MSVTGPQARKDRGRSAAVPRSENSSACSPKPEQPHSHDVSYPCARTTARNGATVLTSAQARAGVSASGRSLNAESGRHEPGTGREVLCGITRTGAAVTRCLLRPDCSATPAGSVPAMQATGSVVHPSQRASGRRARMSTPPTPRARPSTRIAREQSADRDCAGRGDRKRAGPRFIRGRRHDRHGRQAGEHRAGQAGHRQREPQRSRLRDSDHDQGERRDEVGDDDRLALVGLPLRNAAPSDK